LLIDFEGIDGSGKGTQAQRLLHSLRESGYRAQLVSFPRYTETFFGKAVGQFLNGRFGKLDEVNPFLVSLLYAGDRFESRGMLLGALESNDVVVLDRYVPSNIAHQASKCSGDERAELIRWVEQIEYGIYELPRPDMVILLDVPPAEAQRLVHCKRPRSYTDQAVDLQEADLAYLARTHAVYSHLAANDPAWQTIACCRDGQLREIDDIAAEIRRRVDERLP